jgi:hypothetical protein
VALHENVSRAARLGAESIRAIALTKKRFQESFL